MHSHVRIFKYSPRGHFVIEQAAIKDSTVGLLLLCVERSVSVCDSAGTLSG